MKIIQKAVIKKGNKYLILLREPNDRFYPKHWDFAGGSIELGETPILSIEREVMEETGFKVKAEEIIGTYDLEIEKVPLKFILYSTKIISGNIKLSKEHTDYKWSTKEEILKLKIEPFMKYFFEK
jgi:8-oxo-dGTP diphosphatase